MHGRVKLRNANTLLTRSPISMVRIQIDTDTDIDRRHYNTIPTGSQKMATNIDHDLSSENHYSNILRTDFVNTKMERFTCRFKTFTLKPHVQANNKRTVTRRQCTAERKTLNVGKTSTIEQSSGLQQQSN